MFEKLFVKNVLYLGNYHKPDSFEYYSRYGFSTILRKMCDELKINMSDKII